MSLVTNGAATVEILQDDIIWGVKVYNIEDTYVTTIRYEDIIIETSSIWDSTSRVVTGGVDTKMEVVGTDMNASDEIGIPLATTKLPQPTFQLVLMQTTISEEIRTSNAITSVSLSVVHSERADRTVTYISRVEFSNFKVKYECYEIISNKSFFKLRIKVYICLFSCWRRDDS